MGGRPLSGIMFIKVEVQDLRVEGVPGTAFFVLASNSCIEGSITLLFLFSMIPFFIDWTGFILVSVFICRAIEPISCFCREK